MQHLDFIDDSGQIYRIVQVGFHVNRKGRVGAAVTSRPHTQATRFLLCPAVSLRSPSLFALPRHQDVTAKKEKGPSTGCNPKYGIRRRKNPRLRNQKSRANGLVWIAAAGSLVRVKLKKEGLQAKHPVVFVPGDCDWKLELWEDIVAPMGLFRKRLWGGTFGEVYKRPLCWVEHMSLDNETGLDPSGVRVRPVTGLVAADYFAPGYFVWAVLIANLARVGYEEKTMYMAAYDWRLSFQNTEVRDQTLSRIKSNIELMVATNGGNKAVIIPHSMGVLYFLHFMKWVEAPAPMGGGGGPDWCAKHIKAVMNIGGPLLGVPKAVSGLFSAEAKDIAVARAIAPGVLDKDYFESKLCST
ncbi:UNVERIFIED_CONTAM: Phospholipid:diacylglycerol acyltransferase 1 [Sesamum angustifolium]|uniref:phospholipid:diacylglycerol acyltransferase n=1 Tax=Sesamum angustifolium TaxID=2727405 RepID=A0AAW2LJL8_9LAMI